MSVFGVACSLRHRPSPVSVASDYAEGAPEENEETVWILFSFGTAEPAQTFSTTDPLSALARLQPLIRPLHYPPTPCLAVRQSCRILAGGPTFLRTLSQPGTEASPIKWPDAPWSQSSTGQSLFFDQRLRVDTIQYLISLLFHGRVGVHHTRPPPGPQPLEATILHVAR